jgi:hypothetical protein
MILLKLNIFKKKKKLIIKTITFSQSIILVLLKKNQVRWIKLKGNTYYRNNMMNQKECHFYLINFNFRQLQVKLIR